MKTNKNDIQNVKYIQFWPFVSLLSFPNGFRMQDTVNHFGIAQPPRFWWQMMHFFYSFSLFCSNEIIIMVLMINGVPLEEAPRDLSSFLSSYPHFKESASRLCTMKAESIGPHGLVYVCAREFAVTHPHDNKISVMGTDDITTSHIIVIKHSGKLTLTCLT